MASLNFAGALGASFAGSSWAGDELHWYNTPKSRREEVKLHATGGANGGSVTVVKYRGDPLFTMMYSQYGYAPIVEYLPSLPAAKSRAAEIAQHRFNMPARTIDDRMREIRGEIPTLTGLGVASVAHRFAVINRHSGAHLSTIGSTVSPAAMQAALRRAGYLAAEIKDLRLVDLDADGVYSGAGRKLR